MEGRTKSFNTGASTSNSGPIYPNVTPEYPTLIVMIAVLAIILIFCFWGAPGVRAYCKRSICCHCPMDEPRRDSGTPADDRSATPTIILLPFGRMLVVDRNVFTQLQADQTGIDFMELSANLIRAHQIQCGSTPSILDSETTSKGLSPTSLGFSPPSYEDIFGEKPSDLPPSYSELSILFRQRQVELAHVHDLNDNELRSFHIGSGTINIISDGNAPVRRENRFCETAVVREPTDYGGVQRGEKESNNEYSKMFNLSKSLPDIFQNLPTTLTKVPSILKNGSQHLPLGNRNVGPAREMPVFPTVHNKTVAFAEDCPSNVQSLECLPVDNSRYCVMSIENEKMGTGKCICYDYKMPPGNLERAASISARIFYTKGDSAIQTGGDERTNEENVTQEQPCCSNVCSRNVTVSDNGEPLSKLASSGLHIVPAHAHVSVEEISVHESSANKCDSSLQCGELNIETKCNKSDSKKGERQKSEEVVKESSL